MMLSKKISVLALALSLAASVAASADTRTASFGAIKVSIVLPKVVEVSGGRDSAYANAYVTISGGGVRMTRFALNPMISNEPKATAFPFGRQRPDIMIEETTGFPENGGVVVFDPDYFAYDTASNAYYQVRRYGGWFPSEPAVRGINAADFIPGKLVAIRKLAVIPRELGLSATADIFADLVRVEDVTHRVYLVDHAYPTYEAMQAHAVAYRAGDCMVIGTWKSGDTTVNYAAAFLHHQESRFGMHCG